MLCPVAGWGVVRVACGHTVSQRSNNRAPVCGTLRMNRSVKRANRTTTGVSGYAVYYTIGSEQL